jgi:hypothetical protein
MGMETTSCHTEMKTKLVREPKAGSREKGSGEKESGEQGLL